MARKIISTTTTTTTTNTNTSEKKEAPTMKTLATIAFVPVARKNERVLVWDIRNDIANMNHDNMLSHLKAWVAMVDGVDGAEAKTLALFNALSLVVYTGKYASVKERADGKKACMDVITSGRVKAWLYTIRRNGYKAVSVVDTHATERPEEKAVKARSSAKKVTCTEQEWLQFMEWKKASEKGAC